MRGLQQAWAEKLVNLNGSAGDLVREFFVRHGMFTTEGTENAEMQPASVSG